MVECHNMSRGLARGTYYGTRPEPSAINSVHTMFYRCEKATNDRIITWKNCIPLPACRLVV